MILNLGCGTSKDCECINIDAWEALGPDVVLDIAKEKLPYEDGSVDEVRIFHTIEHIRREDHGFVLGEINRVLIHEGKLFIAFPDAKKCLNNYLLNKWGMREYWEKTVCGRGTSAWDFHQSLIYTDDFIPLLNTLGFGKFRVSEEVGQAHNTIIQASKVYTITERAELIKREVMGNAITGRDSAQG